MPLRVAFFCRPGGLTVCISCMTTEAEPFVVVDCVNNQATPALFLWLLLWTSYEPGFYCNAMYMCVVECGRHGTWTLPTLLVRKS